MNVPIIGAVGVPPEATSKLQVLLRASPITLLALNLAVAGPGHGTLAHQLAEKWPGYVAYLISFFTIGIIWVNHHALVSNVVEVTRLLLFLNLVLLLFVVLVPVTTGTVADYLAHGGFDAKLAVAGYGIVLEGMSIGFASMLEWSLGEGRTRVPVPPERRWAARIRSPPATAAGTGDGLAGYPVSRLSRRRSRSDIPPQIPNRSSCSSAYSRHSARTSQPRHTFLASRVEPPFSGKNASGSVCAHSARSCQPKPPASSSSIPNMPNGTTSATAHLLPLPKPRCHATRFPAGTNYIGEITRACLALSQAGYVIMADRLTLDGR